MTGGIDALGLFYGDDTDDLVIEKREDGAYRFKVVEKATGALVMALPWRNTADALTSD